MTVQSDGKGKGRKASRWTRLRKSDFALVERCESACGLDVAKPSQRLSRDGKQRMVEQDETGNVVLPGDPGELVPFAKAEFVALYPEARGKRLRFVVLRPHFEGDEVFIGGSLKHSDRADPDDGHDGLWQLPSGRTVFRSDIPDDYEGREMPDGHYKDLRVMRGKSALSLFCVHPQYREANKHLKRLLTAVLPAIEGTTVKSDTLEAPMGFVARGSEHLNMRFLNGNSTDEKNVMEWLADIVQCGFWTLPGLEDKMQARTSGTVKDVSKSTISIEWSDGSGEVLSAPWEEIAEHIRTRVPSARTANLPIVPLVSKGEKIDAGTTLWGGKSMNPEFATHEDVTDVNGKHRLNLLRIWAVLAACAQYEGREIYPMNLVAPRRSSDIYFRPSVSRVSFTKHPSKMMRAAGVGINADYYTLSHRSRHWRRWREREERRTAAESSKVEEMESAS